ncbi:hypothetical protein L195_g046842, partial [Trifolium pratense]
MLFPVDFTVVDIEEDADVLFIHGRPFLATSRAVIDMEKEVLKLRIGDEEQLIYIRELDLDKKSYPPAIDIADVKKEDLWIRRWGRFRK